MHDTVTSCQRKTLNSFVNKFCLLVWSFVVLFVLMTDTTKSPTIHPKRSYSHGIAVRLPEELNDFIHKKAFDEYSSASAVIRRAILIAYPETREKNGKTNGNGS